MSFPRYPSYKDSGVEWLGAVPAHWDVIRLKNVLQRRITDGPHTTPVFVDEGVPFLSVDSIQDGELHFEGCRFISEADHAEFRKKAFPRMNDLLMGKAASTGKIARVKVDFEFSIWSPLALIRMDSAESNAAFYEQSLKSPIAQAQIDNLCTANTQKNISMDDIPKLILTRPPLTEQTQIAAFLDRETAKIDELVAEQRRLMELLKEKRQAVISHAVTKGLNPDAPMKPSGNLWLGDVPAHWEVKKLKHVKANDRNAFVDGPFGSNLKSEHFIDGGDVYVIESGFATQGRLETDDLKTISIAHFTTIRRSETRGGDIIIAKIGAQYGKSSILPDLDKPAVVSGNSLKLTIDKQSCDVNFVNWHLTNLKDLGVMEDIVNATAQPALSLGEMNNLPMLVPPLSEQIDIVCFLNKSLGEIDTLTAEVQRAIDLLQERRAGLISATVTGQIDVRGLSQTQVLEAAA